MTQDERDALINSIGELSGIPTEVTVAPTPTITVGDTSWRTATIVSDTGVMFVDSTGTNLITEDIPVKRKKRKPEPELKRKPVENYKYSTSNISISGDDILIITNKAKKNASIEFSTTKDKRYLDELRRYNTDDNYFGSQDVFYFDKDFNYVEATPVHNKNKSVILATKNFPRIRVNTIGNNTRESFSKAEHFSGYMIIDKKKFIESEGKVYKTRVRKTPDSVILKEFKKRIQQRFERAKNFINFLRPMIKSIYDEENYEILYGINFDVEEYTATVNIYLKFPNIIIKNSIEQEHLIEDLVVKLRVQHDLTHTEGFKCFWMKKSIEMMRLTTNPIDANAGYAHSHLGNNGQQFSDCCLGDEHVFNALHGGFSIFGGSEPVSISEIEFEGVLLGVHDFVYWESLEGGPHSKIENIARIKRSRIYENFHPFRDITISHTLNTTIKLTETIIKNKKIDTFKEAFILSKQGNSFNFIIDKSVFYKKFHEAFKENEIVEIIQHTGETTVKYNPITNEFFQIGLRDTKWTEKIRKGRKTIANTVPVYMNGKILRPQLVKYEKEPEKEILEIDTVRPELILRIANVLLYHLTKELGEHVRISKEQERRNA